MVDIKLSRMEGGPRFWGPALDLDLLYRPDVRRGDQLEAASSEALTLFVACLRHPSEVVRSVAAVGASEFLQDLGPLAETILAEGCRSGSATVRTLAADALARRNSDHPAIRALSEGDDDDGERIPMNTSMLVHGTWARYRSDWWQPGSEFHEYIRSEIAQDLYAGTDYFRWTGNYSGGARSAAATDLSSWLAAHGVDELTFAFAHSHGGNVVLDAASEGTAAAKLLVLLNVPALERTPEMWSAIQQRVRRIVCLRTKFDLVVALDGGRHRFGPQVRDLTVPGVWFSHDAMLNPEVWRKHNLPKEMAFELGMAGAPGIS